MTDTTKTGGQTSDTQAIAALIEAVRGGDEANVNSALASMFAKDQSMQWDWISGASSAFRGSMDAALTLMGDLLPGWWAEIRISTRPRAKIGNIDASVDEQASTPARALLLATLKAWRDLE